MDAHAHMLPIPQFIYNNYVGYKYGYTKLNLQILICWVYLYSHTTNLACFYQYIFLQQNSNIEDDRYTFLNCEYVIVSFLVCQLSITNM